MLRTVGHGGGPPSRPLSVQPGHKELTHATVAVVTHKNLQISVLQTNVMR